MITALAVAALLVHARSLSKQKQTTRASLHILVEQPEMPDRTTGVGKPQIVWELKEVGPGIALIAAARYLEPDASVADEDSSATVALSRVASFLQDARQIHGVNVSQRAGLLIEYTDLENTRHWTRIASRDVHSGDGRATDFHVTAGTYAD